MPPQLGERFAHGAAEQDAGALGALLTPQMNFRGLTARECRESHEADVVVNEVILGTWFSSDRSITQVLAIDCATIGDVERVGYQLRTTLADGDFVVEQQVYNRTEIDKISWQRLLGSGFVRDEVAHRDRGGIVADRAEERANSGNRRSHGR